MFVSRNPPLIVSRFRGRREDGEEEYVRAGPEEYYHSVAHVSWSIWEVLRDKNAHQGVRKPHFRAVYDAISDSFHEREGVVVFGVQDYSLDHCLPLCQYNDSPYFIH